ncbi:MAG: pyruvate ferredoxin oxidoreductase subunit gamma [Phycisphaerae bacterium]|nr:pyruvate ferredoxin oxidoreductase subunit gamma [Phycisphaerae bacterium]
MKEIRIHGRGGQGSVTAAELLAVAAFTDGKISQAFPAFGSERMGAPVQAFCRISDKKIRTRTQIHHPNYVIVQDASLLKDVDVFEGLKADGMAIINTDKTPEELGVPAGVNVKTIAATAIARDVIGRPIPNTVLVGAFAGFTGEITVDAIKESVKHRFAGKVGDLNADAIQKAYDLVREEK